MIDAFPIISIKQLYRAVVVFAVLLFCDTAKAVVITLQDGTRLGCWIIQKDESEVVVDVVSKSGSRDRKTFKLADITDVSYAVSSARLEKLNPEKPLLYKEYAEELAEITIDPEARPMSLRLYQIALHLAPDEFGESCLLGMIRIARDADEQRRLRAAAFLHLRNQDDTILASQDHRSAADDEDTDQNELLKLLRDLRTRKRMVPRSNELPALCAAISPYAESLSNEELSKRFVFECVRCENGKVDCPRCERGMIVSGNRRTRCTECQRGKLNCPDCDAANGLPALPDHLAAQLVSAELRILSGKLNRVKANASTPADSAQPWSQINSRGGGRTIPALSLRSLTEFDPTHSIYRDGKWVAPPLRTQQSGQPQ